MNTDSPSNTDETNGNVSKGMLPFEGFIHLLKANGFVLGMDNYLQLQALLNQLGPGCSIQRLKQMMGPLFCTTPEQQVLFGRLFDDYFQSNMPRLKIERSTSIKKSSTEISGKTDEKGRTTNVNKVLLIGLLYILGVGVFFGGFVFFSTDLGKPLLDSFIFPADAAKQSGYENITKYAVIFLLILFALLMVWGLWNFYKRNNKDKQLALDSQRLRKPMLHWRIAVPPTKLSLFSTQTFYKATRLLKSREQSESRFLNIPKTIQASLANMGFPKLQYDFRTKPPEYLVLIDKASYRDHQATYFDSLYQSLEEQEIFAVRFYYDKLPSTCWDENDKGFDLETLLKKYHSHRLIIMGDVRELFDPFTGLLIPDLYPILLWKYKAVLTAQQTPPAVVSALNDYSNFVVLTANMENLLSLQDALTMSEPYEANNNGTGTTLNSTLEHLSNENIIKNLKEKLDTETFEWLGVCAVYPELNWPFTLYLGKQVLGEEVLTEERVLELVQLPWYRDGLIPDKLRTALINTLSEERLAQVRQVILDWLKDNPPQVGDARAQSEYELYIAMEAAMLDPESEEKKRWLQSQMRKDAAGKSRYKEIVLQYLEEEVDKESVLALPGWVQGLFGVKEEKGKAEVKEEEGKLFIYPKGTASKRILAKVIDWPLLIFIFWYLGENVTGPFLERMFPAYHTGVTWFELLALFILVEGVFGGLGKRVFGLMTINIKQNKPANLLAITKRYMDVVLMIANVFIGLLFFKAEDGGVSNNYDTVSIYAIFGYLALNFFYVIIRKDGRLPIDFFAGTQVINKKDFMAGNYIGSVQSAKPKDLQAPVEEQKIGVTNEAEPLEVPVFNFYKEEEIQEQVALVSSDPPHKALQLFKTSKQQTWLVSAGRSLFCLLDSAKTRAGERRLVQWEYKLEGSVLDLYLNTKKNPKSKRTGFIDIGNHRNWYYSLSLHPDARQLENTVRNLFIGSRSKETGTDTAKQVFISSVAEDSIYREEIIVALSPFERSGDISFLNKSYEDDKDDDLLYEADVILLLVSREYLGYTYINEVELRRVLGRLDDKSDDRHLSIVPIILHPCSWEEGPFSHLHVLPVGGKPVSEFKSKRNAYTDIARGFVEILLDEKSFSFSRPIEDLINEVIEIQTGKEEGQGQIKVDAETQKIFDESDLPPKASEQIQTQTSEPTESLQIDVEPKQVFVSASEGDRQHRDNLLVWLKPLEGEGLINILESSYQSPQFENDERRDNDIKNTDIFMILFSEIYATSNWARREILVIRNRMEDNPETVTGIPIILNQCDWQRHMRGVTFNAIGADRPILERENVKMAWVEVTNVVRDLAEADGLPKTRPFTNIPDESLKTKSRADEVHQLMVENRMVDALDYMSKNYKESTYFDEILLLKTRYTRLTNLYKRGTYSEAEFKTNEQRIVKRMLDIADIIEGDFL